MNNWHTEMIVKLIVDNLQIYSFGDFLISLDFTG
jgi:hypothetical protein